MKTTSTRASFPEYLWNLRTTLSILHVLPRKSGPAVHLGLAETLHPWHKLRTGQQWPITKISVYFGINSVWELSDMPS
jgi:hypothetical protein